MNYIATPPEREISTAFALTFGETVRARRSFRAFLPDPVPQSVIHQVLEDAQFAPSNCNTQPWNTHIVSGNKRDELSQALLAAGEAGQTSADFSWDAGAFPDPYDDRRREQGKVYYGSLGIAREDEAGRARAGAMNLSFFGAPHAAFLFMPSIGDNVRVASDLGMYGQTFLLSLAAHGLGGVPQTVLGLHADTIRETLGLSRDLKLLFGILFGYPDETAQANCTRMDRAPLSASVTFHDD
ncbi:nitroreductase [Bosea lathyri]|uniref:Nitroreductase n=1 Tax=Bosea lathyri TaxID=1036778 RepID=A0A1H5XWV2_9HYPH|nr:nitroreductase [Bosea lathyri]SEG16269.1 Nitroreductase [Bosea lathyri]